MSELKPEVVEKGPPDVIEDQAVHIGVRSVFAMSMIVHICAFHGTDATWKPQDHVRRRDKEQRCEGNRHKEAFG